MQDLYTELYEQMEAQDELLTQLRRAGVQLAENEATYRVALSKEILMEREKGTPVSIIADICRGKTPIAELRLARDSSQVIYDATKEAINLSKLRFRAIQEQISREYSRYE